MSTIYGAALSGFQSVSDYLSAHVLTCLVPAFFIAGAIGVFVSKESIIKYFSKDAKKHVSYTLASVSGTILAVCSCTILPLFAGIYRRGGGIGPATTFLYSGPAINILAVVYTAGVLGYGLGIARAISAILMSIGIGIAMANLFREETAKIVQTKKMPIPASNPEYPTRTILALFALLIAVLILGTSKIELPIKMGSISVLIIGIVYISSRFSREDIREWGYETWILVKKIFPILLAGTFVVGVIAYLLPPETFRPYLGGNSLASCFTASIVGALLYMPTLLEVPIVGTTFGYTSGVIGGGPALSLLLAGPAVSLPSMLVLHQIMGTKKTLAFIALVVVFSTLAGFVYGNMERW